jgi:hypothetical protein
VRALRGVTVKELATMGELPANQISANLIGETERRERDARPMELRAIADALQVPYSFLMAEDPFER